ncbi:DUF397 domain-containing protein [Streptomyces noursei]|uniref:DUF397 domain-containing protein n=1 Tax=Streptomyces noursei TaxID=1971 RepID=UPI0033EF2175
MTTEPLNWIKSSYSGSNGGSCVEWAPEYAAATGEFLIRDSKNPDGPTIAVSATSFSAFIAAVKNDAL